MEKTTSVPLDRYLLSHKGQTTIDNLVNDLSSENLQDRTRWKDFSKHVDKTNALIQAFGSDWEADWKTRLEKSIDHTLAEAQVNLVNNLTTCKANDLVNCIREYPVKLWKIDNEEPYKLVHEIVRKKATATDSLNIFIEEISLFKTLQEHFLKSENTYANIYWLNNSTTQVTRSVPHFKTMVLQNKIVDKISKLEHDFFLIGLPIQDTASIVDKKSLQVSSKFESGSINKINPQYERISFEIQQLRSEINYQNSVMSSANLSGGGAAFMRGQLMSMQSELRALSNSLSQTPRYVQKKSFSPYTYNIQIFNVERKASWRFFLIDMERDLVWENTVEDESVRTFELKHGVHQADKSAKNSSLDITKLIEDVYRQPLRLDLDKLTNSSSYSQIDVSSNSKVINTLTPLYESKAINYLHRENFRFIAQLTNQQNAQHYLSNATISSQSNYPSTFPITGEFFISKVSNDGGIVSLNDGSVWQVDALDKIDSMLWLPASTVVVVNDSYGYSMINLDDGENVRVEYLGRK
ncbi:MULTISPECIES: hypothetical protein [unclassified Alteromonas]|uniref:hypothetical protein n=1 Tax=unclassified Alteromonas TaxID=2614992 RepID=UPI0013584537|nr:MULTISPECIES: hypothetical protein [unclassified Alteromonas]